MASRKLRLYMRWEKEKVLPLLKQRAGLKREGRGWGGGGGAHAFLVVGQ